MARKFDDDYGDGRSRPVKKVLRTGGGAQRVPVAPTRTSGGGLPPTKILRNSGVVPPRRTGGVLPPNTLNTLSKPKKKKKLRAV